MRRRSSASSETRLSWLVERAEWENIGKNVDVAIDSIDSINSINSGLAEIFPRGYQKLEKSTLVEPIRLFRTAPADARGG